jgi:outer membrane protein
MIRGALAALAALPALALAQGADSPRPISVDEAVRLAQQNQPATVQARNSLRTGESAVRQQLLGYLPTVSLSTSANQRGGTQLVQGVPLPTTGNPWTYGRGINFGSVTVFDGGQRWNNYRASSSQLDASGANEVLQRYNVALSVKTQYYAVLAAREQESAAARQLEQAQQQLRVSSAKMNAGAATRADSLAGAIAVGNARLAILNAENALRNANAALTRLVATPFTVTADPADTGTVAAIDLDDATLAKMVLDGPQVRQSAAQLVAAKASRRAALAPYLPTLQVGGSYSQNPQSSPKFNWGGGPTGLSTNLSFSLNYNIFDRYSREASVVASRVAEDNAEATNRDARFGAQQNLTTQLNNFRTAMQSIELNRLQIASAEENVRVVTQQYNLGTKQQLDLLTAQTQLDQARISLINSRQNARIAKANIEALIGRDIR